MSRFLEYTLASVDPAVVDKLRSNPSTVSLRGFLQLRTNRLTKVFKVVRNAKQGSVKDIVAIANNIIHVPSNHFLDVTKLLCTHFTPDPFAALSSLELLKSLCSF